MYVAALVTVKVPVAPKRSASSSAQKKLCSANEMEDCARMLISVLCNVVCSTCPTTKEEYIGRKMGGCWIPF